jgi:hypothetical protein
MAETAIHLDDNVIPHVPVRQFVLTIPVPVRLWASRNRDLLGRICEIGSEGIQAFLQKNSGFGMPNAKSNKIQGGVIAFVQRFGSALNLNIHVHFLALDGVFEAKSTGEMKFYAAKSPTNEEVARLLNTISKRINKHLVKKKYLEEVENELVPLDTSNLFEHDDLHLPSMAASLSSKIAFGDDAGKPVKRLYAFGRMWPDEDDIENKSDRCASGGGYSLHANTCVKAEDRTRLVQLIRYMARPAVSDERIEIVDNARVRIKLKSSWKDGTTHIEMSPIQVIEKLVAIIPLPRFHLTRYFGILASKAKNRSKIVPPPKESEDVKPRKIGKSGCPKKLYIPLATLLKRTFLIDVLVCAKCGAKMIINAVVTDPAIIKLTLEALGVRVEPPHVLPASPRTLFTESW